MAALLSGQALAPIAGYGNKWQPCNILERLRRVSCMDPVLCSAFQPRRACECPAVLLEWHSALCCNMGCQFQGCFRKQHTNACPHAKDCTLQLYPPRPQAHAHYARTSSSKFLASSSNVIRKQPTFTNKLSIHSSALSKPQSSPFHTCEKMHTCPIRALSDAYTSACLPHMLCFATHMPRLGVPLHTSAFFQTCTDE